MRRPLAAIVVSLFVSAAVMAADAEMQIELMQNIEDVNKSLSSNIALSNKAGATSDAKELTAMFAEVEAHFQQKGDSANAVELATQSKNLSADIIKLVGENNFDAASTASTTLSRTCRTCHTFYKKE